MTGSTYGSLVSLLLMGRLRNDDTQSLSISATENMVPDGESCIPLGLRRTMNESSYVALNAASGLKLRADDMVYVIRHLKYSQ